MFNKLRFNFRNLVQVSLVVIFLLLLLGYAAWQARLLIIGPIITLTDPPSSIQTQRSVSLSGQAKNITGITLNGRTIYTDQAGYFNEALVLENGYTIATLEGTDRYGRTTNVESKFIYKPNTK